MHLKSFINCNDNNYVKNISMLEHVVHIDTLVKIVDGVKFYVNLYTAYKNGKKIFVYTSSSKNLLPINDINTHRLYVITDYKQVLELLCEDAKGHNFNNIVISDLKDYVVYRSYIDNISDIKSKFIVKEFNYGTLSNPELDDLTIDFNDKPPRIKFEFDSFIIQIHSLSKNFTA